MPLAMSRPWKHPKTGTYWLRKRVPDELVKLVGKREELRTLGTKDPAAAKVKHAAVLAEIEAKWASLRAGPKALTEREAIDLAYPIGEWFIGQNRANPGGQKLWQPEFGDMVFEPKDLPSTGGSYDFNAAFAIKDGDLAILRMEKWCEDAAAEISNARGLQLEDLSRQLLARSVARIMQAASLKLKRLALGEPEEAVLPFSAGVKSAPRSADAKGASIAFQKLVEGWAAERQPAPKTLYDWTRVSKQLTVFLGHDDAYALTADDLIRWKESA